MFKAELGAVIRHCFHLVDAPDCVCFVAAGDGNRPALASRRQQEYRHQNRRNRVQDLRTFFKKIFKRRFFCHRRYSLVSGWSMGFLVRMRLNFSFRFFSISESCFGCNDGSIYAWVHGEFSRGSDWLSTPSSGRFCGCVVSF